MCRGQGAAGTLNTLFSLLTKQPQTSIELTTQYKVACTTFHPSIYIRNMTIACFPIGNDARQQYNNYAYSNQNITRNRQSSGLPLAKECYLLLQCCCHLHTSCSLRYARNQTAGLPHNSSQQMCFSCCQNAILR